ncbi:MAG: M48 family metalloprotease [Pseudomonadota bacterium]
MGRWPYLRFAARAIGICRLGASRLPLEYEPQRGYESGMRNAFCLFLSLFCVGLLGVGCVSPTYGPPPAAGLALATEEEGALKAATQTALARRARVYDLAWPILTRNTEFCPKVAPSIGLVIADRKLLATMAGGVREDDMAALGVEGGLHIVHAMASGPAADAGATSGMMLRAIDGVPFTKPKPAVRAIQAALKEDSPVRLLVDDGNIRRVLTVEGQPACQMAVKISQSQDINAHAVGGEVVIYTGLIRALDNSALQFVIAHEAAHIVERHPRKYMRNLAVSGGFLSGPVLYTGASLWDIGAKLLGKRPDVSATSHSLRWVAPWSREFEAEADYLGLYMYARAGGDLSKARGLFDVFSREVPRSIFTNSTHPLTPARIAALKAGIAEIEAKVEAGEELIPTYAQDR